LSRCWGILEDGGFGLYGEVATVSPSLMGPDEAETGIWAMVSVVCLKGLCCSSKEIVEGDGGLGAFSLVAITCREDSSRDSERSASLN